MDSFKRQDMAMIDLSRYESGYENQWCPGCGNFGILEALKIAMAESEITPHEVLLVSGIGQAAKTPHFLECNFFHALHGRALPLATGAKIANHDLTIIVNTGDGDVSPKAAIISSMPSGAM
jgi:2-oxoglutarate ferredoxin oxidoreductase subunit beta